MGFESVRGYVQLASGLGEMTKARATEAAQGLLSLPAAGIATGTKVAGQAGALAEDLLAAATTNHSSLTALVRSEVDVAVTHLGLVPAEKLERAEAEAARLRAEIARLRSASSETTTTRSNTKRDTVPRRSARGTAVSNGAVKPTSITRSVKAATKPTTSRRPGVTTRARPAGA